MKKTKLNINFPIIFGKVILYITFKFNFGGSINAAVSI